MVGEAYAHEMRDEVWGIIWKIAACDACDVIILLSQDDLVAVEVISQE